MLFTQTYISAPYVIFARENEDIIVHMDDLHDKTVVVPASYAIRSMMEEQYPEIELILVDDSADLVDECLKMVSIGEADAFIGNLTVASYIVMDSGYNNIKIAAPAPFEYHENSMAIRSDWPELVSIIDKNIGCIYSI